MWPFTKNSAELDERRKYSEQRERKKQEAIDSRTRMMTTMQEFRKIGETFNYLGRTCIVIGHHYELMGYYAWWPMLMFHYADDNGVIHSESISCALLVDLINTGAIS